MRQDFTPLVALLVLNAALVLQEVNAQISNEELQRFRTQIEDLRIQVGEEDSKTLRNELQQSSQNLVNQLGISQSLGVNQRDFPYLGNVYNSACNYAGRDSFPQSVVCSIKPPLIANTATYEYWEPAAIVEVSCQKGFSLLKPGFMGQGASIAGKPVQPGQCGSGPNWFFEVRVWASNPAPNADRRLSSLSYQEYLWTGRGTCHADGTQRASEYGYGRKNNFAKGPATGPGGSFEAYISDNDPAWSRQLTPDQATQQMQQAKKPPVNQPECQENTPNIQACWGDPSQQNGWVTHPNRAVAAALAGYRGLLKAQGMNRVATPIQAGWRMSMDYPFVKSPSSYAQAMGMPTQGNTRHRGSDCFVPGDGGAWWFTTGRQGRSPRALQAVTNPSATANADLGTYIFSYWVKTSCTVYDKKGGICQDTYHY